MCNVCPPRTSSTRSLFLVVLKISSNEILDQKGWWWWGGGGVAFPLFTFWLYNLWILYTCTVYVAETIDSACVSRLERGVLISE